MGGSQSKYINLRSALCLVIVTHHLPKYFSDSLSHEKVGYFNPSLYSRILDPSHDKFEQAVFDLPHLSATLSI